MSKIHKYHISSFFFIGLTFCLVTCNDINVKPDMAMGFIKLFGGTKPDLVAETGLTNEGGYVFVGTTGNTSNGSGGVTDIYVVKTDMNGDQIWEKRLGSAGADTGVSIKQTSDNGFIVLGTISSGDATSMYLCKLDNAGSMQWDKTIGNMTSGGFLEITSDGGFIILGNTDSAGVDLAGPNKVFLFRTDANGNELFQIDPSGFNANNISATAVVQVNDTTFDWTGTSDVSPVIARNREGGSGVLFAYQKDQDFINEISILSYEALRKTADGGGYILIGTCIKNNNDLQAFLMKLTGDLRENPQKAWFKTYGGDKDEEGYSVVETADGGYALTGYTTSYGNGNEDIYMVKTDANGEEQWHKTFGGSSSDVGVSIKQTGDGGYIIAGDFSLITTPTDNIVVSLIKTDANGEIKNTK